MENSITKKISEKTGRNRLCREANRLLRLRNKIEVAMLIIEFKLNIRLEIFKKLVRLTPDHNSRRVNRHLLKHLSRLAKNIYNNTRRLKDKRTHEVFRETIESLLVEKVTYKL